MVHLFSQPMFSNYEVTPIPSFWPNPRNQSLYSLTRSNWSTLIFLPVYFSIKFFHFTNKFKTTNLCLIGYTKQCLDKSSTKETKYKWPPSDAVLIGPPNINVKTIKKTSRAVNNYAKFHLHFPFQNTAFNNFKLQVNVPFNTP